MKLLTLNCHSWQEDNQLEKIKYLAKTIFEKQYDVIALQEISQRKDTKIVDGIIREDNFVRVLMKELKELGEDNYSFIWDYSHIGYDIYEEGLAILTKHTIEERKCFYISKSDDKTNYRSRNIVMSTISINGRELDFYSCHTGWWHDEIEPFKYQADKLLKNINNERVSFIMGDFNNNALIRGEGYDYLINNGLIDTYSISIVKDDGVTVKGEIDGWEAKSEDKRLDLILTNKKVEVLSSHVIFNNKNKNVVSDHFGVEIIVK